MERINAMGRSLTEDIYKWITFGKGFLQSKELDKTRLENFEAITLVYI